jgi:uncharacterized protein YceK
MNKAAEGNSGKIVVLVMVLVLLNGCRSQKVVTDAENAPEPITEESMISLLEKKTHRFRTLKVRRLDIGFNINGVSDRLKGNMAIYRDSLIAISVIPALGYEALRILCTRDSVIIINRPDKTYNTASFDYYRNKYSIPVDFSDLQAMLANEVFFYKGEYKDRVFEQQINTRENNILFIIDSFREGKRITNQGIEIGSGQILESVFVIDYDTRMRMNLEYEDFSVGKEMVFPKHLRLNIFESNNTVNLDIRYGQIIFDDSLNLEFSAPAQYTRERL